MSDRVRRLAFEHGQGKHKFAMAGCLVCDAEGRLPQLRFDIASLPGLQAGAAIDGVETAFDGALEYARTELIRSLREQGATDEQMHRLRIETHNEGNLTRIVASVPAMEQYRMPHSTPETD